MAKIIIRSGKIALGVLVISVLFVICALAWKKGNAATVDSMPTESKIVDSVELPVKAEILSARDENTRLWEITKKQEVIDPITKKSNVIEVKSYIHEKGCGICYMDEQDNWLITDTSWRQTQNGFVMDKANYGLEMGTSAGSFLNYYIDGKQLQLRPCSIEASDGITTLALAQLNTASVGQIDSNAPNKLIFRNAFGNGIDLEYVALPDGYHQNVVFNQKLSLATQLYPKAAKVHIKTEIGLDNYERSSLEAVVIEVDDTIHGAEEIPVVEQEGKPQPTTKMTVSALTATKASKGDIRFVLGGANDSFTSHRFAMSEILCNKDGAGLSHLAIADKQLVHGSDGKSYLVESLDVSILEAAAYPVVWDYRSVNGTIGNQDWYADATYYVSSAITIGDGNTLRIEPGTIVKFRRDTNNGINAGNGTLIAKGQPYSYNVFTSARDPNMGESIDANTVLRGDWKGLTINSNSVLEFCKVGYAVSSITAYLDQSDGYTLKNNILFNSSSSGTGIYVLYTENTTGTITICNNMISDGGYLFGILVDAFGMQLDANVVIRNNTVQRTLGQYDPPYNNGIGATSVPLNKRAIFNNILAGHAVGINVNANENNNAFYLCTTLVSGGADLTDVNLSASPYDSSYTALGRYFLNNNANGGELLKNAGYGNVGDYYADPNQWSIYPVSDANHYFGSSTNIGTTTWEPNYTTCDSGLVAIGYHHPRVDYFVAPSQTVSLASQATLTVMPGTVVAMGGSSMISGGKIVSNGLPSNDAYIKYINASLAHSGWSPIKYGQLTNGTIQTTSSESQFSFNEFTGLEYGIVVNNYDNLFKCYHDNIFKWNYVGLMGRNAENCIFSENATGMYAEFVGANVTNCTFDRNTSYGLTVVEDSSSGFTARNCSFSNNAIAGISEMSFSSPSPSLIENNNAFYNNSHHRIFDTGANQTYDVLSNSDLSGSPYIANTSLISSNSFLATWTDFSQRFYLPQNSSLVDRGDPCSSPMYGYTTDPNRLILDTNRRDIGYHYQTDTESDIDGLYDYEEYWLRSNPSSVDSDGDGLVDGKSGVITLAAYYTATGHDGLDDGTGHVVGEITAGTNPLSGDTDGDGTADSWDTNQSVYTVVTVTEYTYDDAGDVVKETVSDYNNIVKAATEYQYDGYGRKWQERKWASTSATSDSDIITLYSYDVLGNVCQTVRKIEGNTNYDGEYAIQNGDVIVENFYDSLGRLIDVNSTVETNVIYNTHYTYNASGQIESVRDPNGIVTTNEYDTAGRLYKTVNGEGNYRYANFDSLGHTITEYARTIADVNIMQARTVYNSLGQVTRRTVMANPNSIAAENNSVDMVTNYTYDAIGNGAGQPATQTLYYGGSSPVKTAITNYCYDVLGRLSLTIDPNLNETWLTLNSMGQVTRRKQVDKNTVGGSNITMTTDYVYTSLGQVYKEIAKPSNPDAQTDASWQTTTYTYAAPGNRMTATDPNGTLTTYSYNALGQLYQTVADFGTGMINQTTEYGYDRNGRQTSIKGYTAENGTAQTTTYLLDDLGRVKRITYPDNYYIAYTYNPGGKVTQRTDQRSPAKVTNYVYDHAYNMLTKSVPVDSVVETFTYDGANRMRSAEKKASGSSISLVEYAYNGLGKVIDSNEALYAQSPKRHVDYGYDQAGYLTSMVYPDGNTITIAPDKFGRIAAIAADGAMVATYKYIGPRVAQRKYLTTTNVTYTPVYDNLGRVTSATTDNVIAYPAKFEYLYAANTNNISKETYSHRSGYPKPYAQFAYDRLNRVTRGDYKGSSSAPFNNQYEQFAMDDLGNRSGSQYIRGGSTVSYTANTTTNAYTQVGAAYPAYDYAGNMTTDEQGYTYTYDYENRPLTISKNGTKAEFAYDALGRRINVTDSVAGTTTLYYYNTNWQVLCEKVSGTTQRWYVYGNYIDEPLMMAVGSAKYYYVQDHLYSTVALVNNSGTVVERYEYDAYGKPRIMDASYNVRTASSYGNPYMFTGRNVDRLDSGNLWLQYNRNRYYSYTLCRWLTRDPLGIVPNAFGPNIFFIQRQYKDGMSLYEYVQSHPFTGTDPQGLSFWCTKECKAGSYDILILEKLILPWYADPSLQNIRNIATGLDLVVELRGGKTKTKKMVDELTKSASMYYVWLKIQRRQCLEKLCAFSTCKTKTWWADFPPFWSKSNSFFGSDKQAEEHLTDVEDDYMNSHPVYNGGN